MIQEPSGVGSQALVILLQQRFDDDNKLHQTKASIHLAAESTFAPIPIEYIYLLTRKAG